MKRAHLLSAGVLAVLPFGSYAQTASTEHEATALTEIVVTAQRRAENLQEVPISVTALTAVDLEKTNVKSATDYLMQTPNVSFTNDKQSGSRGLALAIRGVHNLVTGENAFVNSSGLYLDDYSIASVPNGVANPFLPDMERVEVLRGPQGTTFGRNSLGGALNLTSKAPTDKYEGSVQVGAQYYDTNGSAENVTAIYNMPISDTFKLRAVGFYEYSDGMVKNIYAGGNQPKHDWINLRLRGAWTPTSADRVNFGILFGKETQGADETVPSGVIDLDTADTFGISSAIDPGTGFWATGNYNKFSGDLQQKNDLRTVIVTANWAHDLSDHLTWKNIVGGIDSTNDRFFDNDLIGGADLLSRTNHYKGKSYSFETRLESRTTTWDWTVGAMYAQDKQDQFNDVAVSSDPNAVLPDGSQLLPPTFVFPPGLGLALNTKHYKVDSVAAFADATWHVTNATELFAGARFTRDKVDRSLQAYGLDASALPFKNCIRTPAVGNKTFNDVSPRAGVSFKLNEDVNLYFTVSKGYKAGGLSTGNGSGPGPTGGCAPNDFALVQPFAKETLWNYEGGFKSEFADHRVRLNVSVFYMKWKDLQMEAFRFLVPGDLSTNFEQTINIPKAEARGMEIELTARATERLTFGGSLGLLSTELLEEQACAPGSDPVCVNGHRPSTVTGGFNVFLKGLSIPNSPSSTANLYGEYRWPMAGNFAWTRVEFQHRDSVYSDIEGLTNAQTRGPSPNSGVTRVLPYGEFPYKTPTIDVFNVRMGYDWSRAALNLYVQNLTGEDYYTGSYQKFGLSGIRLRPNPRTIGANLTFKF